MTDAVEIQSALLYLAVVATGAIVVYDPSHGRVRPSRWMRGRRLRPSGMTSHEQNHKPEEPADSMAKPARTKMLNGHLRVHSSQEHDSQMKLGQAEIPAEADS